MGQPSRNVEEVDSENELNYEDLDQDISVKIFSMWFRNCFCSIVVKNVVTSCPGLKSLPKAKVMRFRSIALTKEVSKSPAETLFSG